MDVERMGDEFKFSAGGDELVIDLETFEDIYFALPVNTTAFYRLLTEQVAKDDGQREVMVRMINAGGDMDGTLTALQEKVQAFGLD